MVLKHAYLDTLLLLHSAFMLSMVKMLLKGRLGAMHLIVMEIILVIMQNRERSCSVVVCLTGDQGAAGLSLTSVTALWSLSKIHLS